MTDPSNASAVAAPASTLLLDRPDLDRSVEDEPGFRLHLLRWLVAVASADDHISLAEYEAIRTLADESGSALDLVTALRTMEQPTSADAALAALRSTAAPLDGPTRRQALARALPVLRLQGRQALPLAVALAAALNVELSCEHRASCGNVARSASWQTALTSPLRTLQGRSVRSAAIEAFRMTGDSHLPAMIDSYEAGEASLQDVQTTVANALQRIDDQSLAFEEALRQFAVDEAGLQRTVDSAEQLFQQVGQRLAIVEARIASDREHFDEEFEEVIHDAGNAVELEMLDRLKTDDWTLKKVWESIGRSTFAKELERRIDRIARHHERQLHLMKEDLRLFQQEYRLVQSKVLERTHHTKLGALMPGLRAGTRVLNATEDAANVTLASGVLAGLGTGAAIYALGAAAVLPVVAPIAPIAGGAILVAGAIKGMMDKPARKGEEVRDKRLALEQALRERLSAMRTSYFGQLDRAGQEFLATARVLVRPVLLEAQARRELTALERRVGERVLRRSQQAVSTLQGQVAGPSGGS